MSDYVEIKAIVEGKTEQIFIQKILGPYLALQKIFMPHTVFWLLFLFNPVCCAPDSKVRAHSLKMEYLSGSHR